MQRTTSAKINLDKRRIKKDGKYPVKLAVYYKGEQAKFSTGVDFTEVEFQHYIQGRTAKTPIQRIRFIELNRLRLRAEELLLTMKDFKTNTFMSLLSPTSPCGIENGLLAMLKTKVDVLRDEGRIKYADTFQMTLSNLKRFRNAKDILISLVDEPFLNEYTKWMREIPLSTSTIGINARNIRTIFNEAISDKLVSPDAYPFGNNKYSPPTATNNKRALTASDLTKLATYSYLEGDGYHRAIDFFIFSFLLNGANFKDIALLKFSNIKGDRIGFVRSKTKNTDSNERRVEAKYNDTMQKIVAYWGNEDKALDNYIFPIIDSSMTAVQREQKIHDFIGQTNKKLKIIGKEQGIGLKITTYSARHSYATILQNQGISVIFP